MRSFEGDCCDIDIQKIEAILEDKHKGFVVLGRERGDKIRSREG